MKKIFFTLFILVVSFAGSTVHAQIITKQVPVKKNTTIKTIPPPPAPAPASNPAPAQQPVAKQEQPGNTPVYTLTSARVNIRTGSDNKEFPSEARVSLWLKNQAGYDYGKTCLFLVHTLKNEMRVNSNTEFGLEKYDAATEKFTLESLQRDGLKLNIGYITNFFMDAWKIEGITLTLEFKDQNGNLHPTLGTKTITFNDAYGFLNSEYKGMVCTTDQNFNSLTSSIVK